MEASIIISSIALTISACSLGWNIYQFTHSKRGKFKFFVKDGFDMNEGAYDATDYLLFSVVNISEGKRYIKEMQIEYGLEQDDKTTFQRTIDISFPLCLEKGEQYEYKLTPKDVHARQSILHFDLKTLKATSTVNDAKYARLVVIDTTGKVYKSEWRDLKQLLPHSVSEV